MKEIRIAAAADVHSPRYLEEFRIALYKIKKPNLFLFAGDMVNLGKISEYQRIIEMIDVEFGTEIPIISCFGNEEYSEGRNQIRSLVGNRIEFLDEQSITIELYGKSLGIVGAANPITSRDNHEATADDIREIFEARAKRLSKLLEETSKKAGYTILLVHYSPLHETKHSDGLESFSWWISKAIREKQPNLVVHGHIHTPDKRTSVIGNTEVINVAFPNSFELTELLL